MKSSLDSKLKILHIASGDLWAGAEAMTCNLLRRLKEYDDLSISVVVLNKGRLADELEAYGVIVHVIDERLHSFPEITRKIHGIVRNYDPAIIHSHRYKENILSLLVSRPCPDVALVSTQHGLPEFLAKKGGLVQRLKMKTNFFALSRYFTTVAVSEDIRTVLTDHLGFSRGKVPVVHNGIELPAGPFRRQNGLPFVIGSSGRLFPIKDYPLMVEVAGALAANADIRFELAGDGPELAALETLIQRRGLTASFFLNGHQHDMAPFYRGLDLYINTSIHEGIPMTILEALAHGLPVIAPAVGGIVEIIEDGKEGFLVDSRDPHRFAEKCRLLIENRELRERMAKAARAKAERLFSAVRMAKEYHCLYTGLQGRFRVLPS